MKGKCENETGTTSSKDNDRKSGQIFGDRLSSMVCRMSTLVSSAAAAGIEEGRRSVTRSTGSCSSRRASCVDVPAVEHVRHSSWKCTGVDGAGEYNRLLEDSRDPIASASVVSEVKEDTRLAETRGVSKPVVTKDQHSSISRNIHRPTKDGGKTSSTVDKGKRFWDVNGVRGSVHSKWISSNCDASALSRSEADFQLSDDETRDDEESSTLTPERKSESKRRQLDQKSKQIRKYSKTMTPNQMLDGKALTSVQNEQKTKVQMPCRQATSETTPNQVNDCFRGVLSSKGDKGNAHFSIADLVNVLKSTPKDLPFVDCRVCRQNKNDVKQSALSIDAGGIRSEAMYCDGGGGGGGERGPYTNQCGTGTNARQRAFEATGSNCDSTVVVGTSVEALRQRIIANARRSLPSQAVSPKPASPKVTDRRANVAAVGDNGRQEVRYTCGMFECVSGAAGVRCYQRLPKYPRFMISVRTDDDFTGMTAATGGGCGSCCFDDDEYWKIDDEKQDTPGCGIKCDDDPDDIGSDISIIYGGGGCGGDLGKSSRCWHTSCHSCPTDKKSPLRTHMEKD